MGDCLEMMKALDTASVDALICDPPSSIFFMGRSWDNDKGGRDKWIAWLAERMKEARRVLKPGHYGLVWALPRTSHYTGMALEDAGFTICERIAHVFGSGFPKGKNKLKPAVEDWWLIRAPGSASALHIDACRVGTEERVNRGMSSLGVMHDDNWKPGNVENIAVGRWPPNLILQHANCIPNGVKRVRGSHKPGPNGGLSPNGKNGIYHPMNGQPIQDYADADGRETVAAWECEPGCPIAALDEQSGELTSGAFRNTVQAARQNISKGGEGERARSDRAADTGGAARFYPNLDPPFFYAAKSSRRERNTGCDGLYWLADDTRGSGYRPITRAEYDAAQEAGERVARGNMHPCVKSSKLMLWLINLLTVPGDVILDPFAGSGSTGVPAVSTGRQFIGIEADPDYMTIAEARLAEAAARPRQVALGV